MVAVACLALLPLEAYVLAGAVIHAFTMRYVLPTTLVSAILLAWGLDWRIGDRPKASVLACLLIAMCFLANFVYDKRFVTNDAARLRDVCRFLEDTNANLLVVIADPSRFFEISPRASSRLAARLTYLEDVNIATHRVDTDTLERRLIVWKEIATLRVTSYQSFLSAPRPLLVSASPGYFSWLVPQLVEDGARTQILRVHSDGLLYLAKGAGSGNP
jgi:hypothetical protein